jgi:hypothetical protein
MYHIPTNAFHTETMSSLFETKHCLTMNINPTELQFEIRCKIKKPFSQIKPELQLMTEPSIPQMQMACLKAGSANEFQQNQWRQSERW